MSTSKKFSYPFLKICNEKKVSNRFQTRFLLFLSTKVELEEGSGVWISAKQKHSALNPVSSSILKINFERSAFNILIDRVINEMGMRFKRLKFASDSFRCLCPKNVTTLSDENMEKYRMKVFYIFNRYK